MTSVIIAAHDEGRTIQRCLEGLLEGALPGELEIVVAANGCSDDTVEQARRVPGVTVLDLPEPGKAAAINAAERVALTFPRAYLDADMTVPVEVGRALVAALDETVQAAYPVRRINTRGRPLGVRAYYAVNNRLPAVSEGMYGRGLMVVSEAGRARFSTFPEMVADDLFLDSQFGPDEKRLVTAVHTTVEPPHSNAALLRRLTRVRRGNADLRRASASDAVGGAVRSASRWSWFTHVVLLRPWLAPAGVVYVVFTLIAERRAALTPAPRWTSTGQRGGDPDSGQGHASPGRLDSDPGAER